MSNLLLTPPGTNPLTGGQGNQLKVSGSGAFPDVTPAPAFPPQPGQSAGQSQPSAPIGVIGPTIVGLLAQPKLLKLDDVYKAISSDLGMPDLSPDDKRALIADSVSYLSELQKRLQSLGPNAMPQNVDGVIRSSLHDLGMTPVVNPQRFAAADTRQGET